MEHGTAVESESSIEGDAVPTQENDADIDADGYSKDSNQAMSAISSELTSQEPPSASSLLPSHTSKTDSVLVEAPTTFDNLQELLSDLLKVLGEGVVATSQLPKGADDISSWSNNHSSDSENLGGDFAFATSFPEVSQALASTKTTLVAVVEDILSQFEEKNNKDAEDLFLDDSDEHNETALIEMWERCDDVCERLLDELESTKTSSDFSSPAVHSLRQRAARVQSQTNAQKALLMRNNLVDMIKPQIAYKFSPYPPSHNSRTDPWIPPLTSKPHAVVPLDLTLQPGAGLDSRSPVTFASASPMPSNTDSTIRRDIVAPQQHVKHPYQVELEQLNYMPIQLCSSSYTMKSNKKKNDNEFQLNAHDGLLPFTWIDTDQELEKLVRTFSRWAAVSFSNTAKSPLIVAFDLEAHNWRSFGGFVCLMQVSVRDPTESITSSTTSEMQATIQNYLIDTLALHGSMHLWLPIMTDPHIVKVMHGSDSDILWFQRDFGLYVINLFDTGRAARELNFASASYAYLLQRYVRDVQVDKSNQLADWRQRPLPQVLQQYAIQDTHYLLDIYSCLLVELETSERICSVLDKSKLICLSRYTPQPFYPRGYEAILSYSRRSRRSSNTVNELDSFQLSVLRRLWEWRDRVARAEDENVQYVCPNSALLRIALASPQITSCHALRGLFNPLPSPLILPYADEILEMVQLERMNHKINENPSGVGSSQLHDERHAITSGEIKVGHVSDSPVDGPDSNQSSPDRAEADHEMRTVMMATKLQSTPPASASKRSSSTPHSSTASWTNESAFSSLKGDDMDNTAAASPPSRDAIMSSPVLETEELYLQAGWMTPDKKIQSATCLKDATTTSASSAGEDVVVGEKPKRHLSLHSSNKDYQSNNISSQSSVIISVSAGSASVDANEETLNTQRDVGKSGSLLQTGIVDGTATIRAAQCGRGSTDTTGGSSASTAQNSSVDDEIKIARRSSSSLNLKLRESLPTILGLVTPLVDDEDDDSAFDDGRESSERGDAIEVDSKQNKNFPIPRSMREIYKISNRNRRNKKPGSPTPDRGVTPTTEKEQSELNRVDAFLKENCLLPSVYFDETTGSGKRARTSTSSGRDSSGRDSEESLPPDSEALASRDDDLELLKKLGWLPNGEPKLPGADHDESTLDKEVFGIDYSSFSSIGLHPNQQPSNPFFAGAALVGGPLTQGVTKPDQKEVKKSNPARGKPQSRRQEHPEKKSGRVHSYRKR